ncbi:Hypothetical Protein FCC1311_096482 [Hondaea fermentalgiana]|uniref:Uncharacterized protein n=1 Tax=Hondaea fermentalgiana TaxID=2315210 RepID=A0A2R5GS56_9STRA|nr:Hypothetical Protein FCC1311_096482 [Hondaea fermentalgiana]|eukprot:GBG33425.1 Hypothetical Protein FCC1311_096482 [Hondaea fermentalgiana]
MSDVRQRRGGGESAGSATVDATSASRDEDKSVLETLEQNAEALLETAEEVVEEVVKDAFGFNDWQLKWFRAVMRKTVLWTLLYIAAIALLVHNMEDPVVPPFAAEETWRVVLTGLGTLLAWVTIYVEIWLSTPPEEKDVKLNLLGKNVNGHFTYLTFHIILATLIYWNMCFMAELAWVYGVTNNQDIAWARKLLKASYMGSGMVGAFGVALALLFLKFNWFEPKWRKTVLETYHSRGHTSFGPKMLFTHLNQTPLAVFDMLIIKERAFIREHMLEFKATVLFVALYGSYYIFMTHVNYRLSNEYPYPFLHKMLATWRSEMIFIFGIVVFINALALVMGVIASIELGIHAAQAEGLI